MSICKVSKKNLLFITLPYTQIFFYLLIQLIIISHVIIDFPLYFSEKKIT